MALDTLKRIGKSGAVGLLGKNLRRVAGNVGAVIRGDIGGPDSSTSAPINRTKQSTKMLSFPIDVGADPGIGNNGHYVMFFINEQKNLKLSFGDETAKPEGAMNMAKALQQKGIPAVQKMFDSKLGSFVQKAIPNLLSNNILSGFTDIIGNLKTDVTGRIKHNPIIQNTRIEDKNASIGIERPRTTRLDTAISMYMPASVSVSYGADYVDTPIGVGTSELNKAGNVDLQSDAGRETIKSGLKNVGAAVKREGIDSLGKLDGLSGIREVAEMRDGVIFADRMELAFKGIGKRDFSFDFKMMPRSQAEADEIRDIIYAFKFNMMPEYVGTTKGNQMKIPNTFDIQYMYQNAENNYLNKISTCFLKDMTVTYGGDRYKTFDQSSTDAGAPPIETTIKLNFLEIEMITRERIAEGF
tara:strand:+ start:40 stop:1275 length:1236 start_codon:yes stop_codon:yes gene_type:complete